MPRIRRSAKGLGVALTPGQRRARILEYQAILQRWERMPPDEDLLADIRDLKAWVNVLTGPVISLPRNSRSKGK